MESETEPEVEGSLIDDHILISNSEMRQQLELKGYGEESCGNFYLCYFEALHLLYLGKLKLSHRGRPVNFDRMMEKSSRASGEALIKFLIYRDLRTRGYVVKEGFGFGADFRVYERGGFGEKGARYLIFGMSEGKQEKIGALQKKIGEMTQMGKEPIIAVVERRGEVIYYRITGITFRPNRCDTL